MRFTADWCLAEINLTNIKGILHYMKQEFESKIELTRTLKRQERFNEMYKLLYENAPQKGVTVVGHTSN